MSGHQARTRVTPNADPERANLVLTGTGDPARDALQRIEDAGVRRRKNGVLAIELVLTASPSFFRPEADQVCAPAPIHRLKPDRRFATRFDTLRPTFEASVALIATPVGIPI
jgi:hypothetical protein